MAKKSVMDEAKGLFSSWKKEIEEKDGHILERKRLRDKEDEELYENIKLQFKEVSKDINQKAQKALEITVKEFSDFSDAVKEGTASIYKKLEIEKHLNELDEFFNKTQSKNTKNFKNISDIMKEKMAGYETELNSEVEEIQNIKKNEGEDISSLIKLAQEEYELKKK